MKLEDQVCSLGLAKQLKELGVKQESYFFYEWYSDKAFTLSVSEHEHGEGCIEIAAFTVAELGEIIPRQINNYYIKYIPSMDGEGWGCVYSDLLHELKTHYIFDKKEADSRAKMLIYLIENKFINLMDKEIVKNDKTP